VPGGKITYTNNFKKFNYFIGEITPKERSKKTDEGFLIFKDPVYFSLQTPRNFEKGKITLKYKLSNNLEKSLTQIIELGILADKNVWNYEIKPLENSVIDNLVNSWSLIKKDNLILLQKFKNYENIDSFINNLPESKKIVIYNYSLKNKYVITNYKKSTDKIEINIPLKGNYIFYTYVKDEILNYDFYFSDLNENKDFDNIDINVYSYKGDLIYNKNIEDKTNGTNGEKIFLEKEGLFIADLPEGIYKIEVKANDDIITNKIITSQKYISFLNRLWLAQYNDKINLFTDTQEVKFSTINPDSLQTVFVYGSKFSLDETYRQISVKSEKQVGEIILEKGDVIVSGNGVFGFNKDIINPNYKKIDENINLDKIDYILADYNFPMEFNDYKIASAEFDLNKAYSENGKYSFIISTPFLNRMESDNRGIIIKEIAVELTGKTLKEEIINFFKNK